LKKHFTLFIFSVQVYITVCFSAFSKFYVRYVVISRIMAHRHPRMYNTFLAVTLYIA